MRDPRNLDTRNHEFSAGAALASLDGLAIEGTNAATGSAARVISLDAVPDPASMSTDALLVARALEHVGRASTVMGFDDTQTPEFVADPTVSRTTSGAAAVHMQQLHRGVPLFHMNRTVTFSSEGRLVDVAGESVGVPEDLDVVPKIGAAEALLAAAQYIATPVDTSGLEDAFGEPLDVPSIDLTGYDSPEVLASFSSPTRATVFDKGPFEETPKTQLVVFYAGPHFRLGWEVMLTLPGFTAQYVIIVAADVAESAEILYCQNTLQAIRTVFANVYTSRPHTDGTDGRTLVPCPRPLADYPLEAPATLPPAFPFAWVPDNGDLTSGNNAVAVRGFSTTSFRGTAGSDRLEFNAQNLTGDDQKVANIFYYCNYMHDFFFMLGFDEVSGNFQQVNFSTAGRGGDPVVARAHPAAVTGTANMATRADGARSNMNMGLLTRANRHTAFDADVVFHEYVHGVSNRLVGGRLDALALNAPQSRAMGEGWSDFYALTIANFDTPTERVVLGDWVSNNGRGIRSAPYDTDYPNSFRSLANANGSEHRAGEVWCAALMQMTRNLVNALGDKARGYRLAWRIVLDGMKLTPAQPSFLDARNAILTALDALGNGRPLTERELALCTLAAWEAFARFGMGANASSPSAEMNGIREDRTVPPAVIAAAAAVSAPPPPPAPPVDDAPAPFA
jgi:extracellular elastinolytic metalloproteinase